MSDSDYVNASSTGVEIYAVVDAYSVAGLELSALEVRVLYEELRRRLAPGMTISGGPRAGVAGLQTPLVTLTFTLEHAPLPLETIIEWLREQPVIRLIEVERRTYCDPRN